jgi:ubiquinone/menaquinone biosynthesis C-methylase UbiE
VGDQGRLWDDAYRAGRAQGVSWFQPEPVLSLELIHLLGARPSEPVIDVGGGASSLVDRLVDSGFVDISVLDISDEALRECRRRLGTSPAVTFIHQDLLTWQPPRQFDLWHDRAVFHFLADEADKATYLATLSLALLPGGSVVVATFAQDGPEYCSGLPVARYSGAQLTELLGKNFTTIAVRQEIHTTPTGTTQPFTWIAAKMAPHR